MDLRNFVAATVADVNDAIVDIKKQTGQDFKLKDDGYNHGTIHFDVAVTAGNEDEVQGEVSAKAGLIQVLTAKAGARGTIRQEQSQYSRISFDFVWEVRHDVQPSNRS